MPAATRRLRRRRSARRCRPGATHRNARDLARPPSASGGIARTGRLCPADPGTRRHRRPALSFPHTVCGKSRMMRNWVAIQRNPISGHGQNRRELLRLVDELRRLGFDPRLYASRARLQRRMDDPNWRNRLRCIVAAGGDGTVADVINRFPDVPVTTLPLGHENLLARYWGLPSDGRRLAHIIAADHRIRVDLGEWNGRRFTLMCSIGFDGHVVLQTHARRRGHIRRWNYLLATARTLWNYRHPPQVLRFDSGQQVQAFHAIIVNNPGYAMQLSFTPQADPRDGAFDVCVFLRRRRRDVLRYLARAALGRIHRDPNVRIVRACSIEVTPAPSAPPAPVQLDGDPAGHTAGTCRILPAALTLIVPGPR
ncbi:MAG: diacylglycerol kinase [Planctomycetota bacterium]|nr:MAG: diacylglycerol kinase [Planctomycetota bacterium]